MPKLHIDKDQYNIVQKIVAIQVPFEEKFEDGYYTVYTPAFDLSAYAKTEIEAKTNLSESIVLLLVEINARGTLMRVLTDLGWTINNNYQDITQPQIKNVTVASPSEFLSTKEINEMVLCD